MHSRVPRAYRTPTDRLPSDRAPERKTLNGSASPALTHAHETVARPRYLTEDGRAAKLLDDALNRKRLARLVYRRRVTEPEFALLADMLGLDGAP